MSMDANYDDSLMELEEDANEQEGRPESCQLPANCEGVISMEDWKFRISNMSKSGDFDAWVSLVRDAEDKNSSPELLTEIYSALLDEFPLCFGYWKRWAMCVAPLNKDRAKQIFEKGVKAIDKSVELWISFLDFLIDSNEREQHIRSVIESALAKMGHDWDSEGIWRYAIEFEKKCLRREQSPESARKVSELYFRRLAVPNAMLQIDLNEAKEFVNQYSYGPIADLVTVWEQSKFKRLLVELEEQAIEKVKQLEVSMRNDKDKMNEYLRQLNAEVATIDAAAQKVQNGKPTSSAVYEGQADLQGSDFVCNDKRQVPLSVDSNLYRTTLPCDGFCDSMDTDLKSNGGNAAAQGGQNVKSLKKLKAKVDVLREIEAVKGQYDKKESVRKCLIVEENEKRRNKEIKSFLIVNRVKLCEDSLKRAARRADFERRIRRSYFHPKPIDSSQLSNWKAYITFEKSQMSESSDNTSALCWEDGLKENDFGVAPEAGKELKKDSPNKVSQLSPLTLSPEDTTDNLYRRILVTCNNYVTFWTNYSEWKEEMGNLEEAKHILVNGAHCRLKHRGELRIVLAEFEELYENVEAARSTLSKAEMDFPHVVDIAMARISLEYRYLLANKYGFDKWKAVVQSIVKRFSTTTDITALYARISRLLLKMGKEKDALDMLRALTYGDSSSTPLILLKLQIEQIILGHDHLCEGCKKSKNECILSLVEEQTAEEKNSAADKSIQIADMFRQAAEKISLQNECKMESKVDIWHRYLEYLIVEGFSIKAIRNAKKEARKYLSSVKTAKRSN